MTHGIPPGNRTTNRRTKSIGTKLTADEYDQVVRVADGHTLGEWVRDVLLRVAVPKPADHVLLAEILALRTIVLNLQFTVASGEPLTTDAMKRLIERADQEKTQRAADRLVAAMPRR
jgi:hypothetical protein